MACQLLYPVCRSMRTGELLRSDIESKACRVQSPVQGRSYRRRLMLFYCRLGCTGLAETLYQVCLTASQCVAHKTPARSMAIHLRCALYCSFIQAVRGLAVMWHTGSRYMMLIDRNFVYDTPPKNPGPPPGSACQAHLWGSQL